MMKTKTILVTGGAGYIGSHTARLLADNSYKVIVLDNLVYGHKEAIVNKEITLIEGDIADKSLLKNIFKEYDIEAVLHFAAFTYVGESVNHPAKYYQNNVAFPLSLLEMMNMANINKFIFSSTCATYGNPLYVPIDEKHPQNPINPYGESKFMLEKIIKDFSNAYGIKYTFLRYFNASGAWEDGSIGEDHDPETHLIPLVLKTAQGELDHITVFGTDYDTPDGTCIRDYIHVIDLAKAHLCALEHLLNDGESLICNLGTGYGVSVKEVIKAAEDVTGKKIATNFTDRRPGDAKALIANPDYAKSALGWEAEYKDIKEIIRSAWLWHNGVNKGKYIKQKADINY